MSQRLNSSTSPPTLALEPGSSRIGRVWRRQVANLRSAYGLSDTISGRVWTVDLIVLALLVSATILFGGALRHLRVPSTSISLTGEQVRELYEPAMALIFIAALWRLGLRGLVKRLRATLPLLAFAVFWLGGVIAAARGTVTFGSSQILPDLGLFEYSLFVPLIAVVVDSKERALRLLAVVSAAAAVITVVFGILWEFDSNGAFLTKDPYAAITLYMALFALPVLARLSLGCRVLPLEIVVGACALVLITLSVVRSAVVALVVALAVIVLLAPRGRHLLALAFSAGGLAIALGGGLAIEAWNPQINQAGAAPSATPISDVAANDASTQFFGGTVVTGDAAEGRAARLLHAREPLELGVDVQPGQTYTVLFAVKPLSREVTSGYVGNSTGLSWGQAYWTAAPEKKWQFFEKTLKANVPTDQLALSAVYGSPRVLFDAIRVVEGRQPGWSGDYLTSPVRFRKGFVANDAVAPLFGGRSVVGGAAQGHLSRLLERGDQLGIKVGGLRPGATYTVRFAVKPLSAKRSAGFVGDPHGAGWGQRGWQTAPRAEWQRFHVTLRATLRNEELVISPRSGAPQVEVDAVELLRGGHLAPHAAPPKKSTWHQEGTRHSPARKPPPGPGELPLASDLKNTFAADTISGQNASWRLAIWHHMVRQTLKEPLLGVGFGKPANFVWHGIRYDARVGDKSNPFDVLAPHNSFVNLLYRTGLVGFLGLLAILAVAAIRVWRALHVPGARPFDRAVLLGCVGAFVFSAVIASFNVALEAPFLALIFWLYLSLLLVLPGMLDAQQEDRAKA
jgi:hypothetical protein